MKKRKCKVKIVATVTAYVNFSGEGEPIEIDEIDEIDGVEDFEVLRVIL